MKKILLAILVSLTSMAYSQTVTALDPTQVYTTGNIVNNTQTASSTTSPWQNVGLWNQGLPCWGPGGPVYCGPLPYFNQGSINFSYGLTDLYQVANIANTLPNSGTGLRVNGFNFSFTAKNGNGWDDGRVDYLTAYVKFLDPAGNVVTDRNYNLNYKFDWTTFNYSETFTTPYARKDLSTVRYGFVGGDNNFWAGPYGPEIYNINFSLKYSVDPCVTNVFYSPSCSGYADALSKLTATPTVVNTTNTPVESTTTTLASPTTATTTTNSVTTTSMTNTANASLALFVTPTGSTGRSVDNTSIGLSVVARNQQREQSIAMQASQNAIQSANEVAAQLQQESVNIALQSASASSLVTQTTTKSITSSNENRITSVGADNMFQNNAATSLSLFVSPTVTTTQKQVDNNQSNISSSSNLPQTTRNNQNNQQVVATENTINTSPVQTNSGVFVATESEIKPLSINVQSKPVEVNTVTQTNNQETNINQNQQTYTLLPPQNVSTVQQPTIQKNNTENTQVVNEPVNTRETPTTQTSIYSLLPPQATSSTSVTEVQIFQPLIEKKQNENLESQKLQENNNAFTTTMYSLLPPQQQTTQQQIQQTTNITSQNIQSNLYTPQNTVQTTNENLNIDSQKFLLDRSNPVFQTLENKNIEIQSNMTVQQTSSVNTNSVPNELSGNVDINKMAQAPAGYNAYLSLTLKDASFYAPKEVYKNQRTIDNARLLRQLSSDRLHQQMVNSQYERK